MAEVAERHVDLPCELQVTVVSLPWGHLGESALPGCRVAITDRPLTRRETCLVVVHEAGHKAGLAHTASPKSIMYPDPTVVGYPPCVRFDLLELRLDNLRLDLHTARHFDRDRAEARRVARKIRRVKRLLGP